MWSKALAVLVCAGCVASAPGVSAGAPESDYDSEVTTNELPTCMGVSNSETPYDEIFTVSVACGYGVTLRLESCRGVSCASTSGPWYVGPNEDLRIEDSNVGIEKHELTDDDRFTLEFRVEEGSPDAGSGETIGSIRVDATHNKREPSGCGGCRTADGRMSPRRAGLLLMLVAAALVIRRSNVD